MATAPHHLASQSGAAVLREGGNAIEAMLAMAATIAVVYPQANALGGDGFWLIAPPTDAPFGIDGAGRAAPGIDHYRALGLEEAPFRGPQAANTVAGAVAAWAAAYDAARAQGGNMSWERLLADAIFYALNGMPVSETQRRETAGHLDELADVPGFKDVFLDDAGAPPATGSLLKQPALAETLAAIASSGPDDFYRGTLADRIAADLEQVGSPVTKDDLARQRAYQVDPLSLDLSVGTVFNMPPPTQGLASLLILGLFDRLDRHAMTPGSFEYVHALVEATKAAFKVRDREIGEPDCMTTTPAAFLDADWLDRSAAIIDPDKAQTWSRTGTPGDTVWMGAIDSDGLAVSYIQSIYWEFGSGVVLPETGILWQNRGASFSLDPASVRALAPGRRPFHTLNPPLARLNDGSTLVYGCMGGDGQPQFQSAVFTRAAMFGAPLQEAVNAPRWLLGRSWGEDSTSLKLEGRFPAEVIDRLAAVGHEVQVVDDITDQMGHAGAIRRTPDGMLSGAADPRSDGAAVGY